MKTNSGQAAKKDETAEPDKVLAYVVQHPLVVVTLAGLASSLVGYICDVYLLNSLGVDLAPYADAGDFLIFGLRRPVMFVVLLCCFLLLARAIRINGLTRFTVLNVFSVLALFLSIVVVPMMIVVDKRERPVVLKKESHNTTLVLRNGDRIVELSHITATSNFVFFHQLGERDNIVIAPISNIISISTPVSAKVEVNP
jgi:hypothetical protein